MPSEVMVKKELLIAEWSKVLAERHNTALSKWVDEGRQGELPPEPSFFDGPLVRVVPSETYVSSDPTSNPVLVIPLGRTSYFEYVATRDLDQLVYTEDDMALPLAMCGVVTAEDRNRDEYLIYTVRTTLPESYPGYLHVVGGMLARPEWDMANPTRGWVKELSEEAGILQGEVDVMGSLGLVMDRHWPHPEVTHRARLNVPLDEIFECNEVELIPRRPTDKEVTLRCIPWRPETVQGLITATKIPGGDQDLRPWVPTGLANLLLAGRVDFGQEWFDKVLKEYSNKIALLALGS